MNFQFQKKGDWIAYFQIFGKLVVAYFAGLLEMHLVVQTSL